MTNLAGQCTTVGLMHRVLIAAGQCGGMTIHALRVFGSCITMRIRSCCICGSAMQIGAFMTFHAVHACLTEVYIAREAFILAQEFIPHAAAVAGCAGTRHGWSLLKDMTGEESAAHVLWLADMTLTASRVTGGAVISEHFLEYRVVFRCATCVNRRPVACLCRMQRKRIGFGLFFVTFAA